MYESKHEAPLAAPLFVQRLLTHLGLAFGLLVLSLGAGMLGYHTCEGLPWLDSFLNAAMLLGGMGPVNAPLSVPGKLFAGMYALYAGLVFIVVAALLFSPVVHRLLHHFHWDDASR